MFFNYFCIYRVAPSTILFSKLCAVVTSLATTYACTGSCVCPATASANWLVSVAPTILNCGGCGCACAPLLTPALLPLGFGILVDKIFITLAKPPAIIPAAAIP